MQNVRTRRKFDIVNYLPYLLIILAIVLIIVFLTALLPGKEKSVGKKQLTAMAIPAGCRYWPFAGGAVFLSDEESQLCCLDDRGELIWGFSGTVPEMNVVTGRNRLGVTVGRKLQVIDSAGTLAFSTEFEKPIAAVAMGEKLIAVSLTHSDEILILNSTGREIDRITSSSDCTIIRFGVYGDNSVWVITVAAAGFQPKYQLSTYKYDNGKTQTVTFEDDSQMMYDAVFDDKLCYIFGTQKLMVRDCDYTGVVNEDFVVNGFDAAAAGKINKNVAILLKNGSSVKAITNGTVRDIVCEEPLKFTLVAGQNYYGFSEYRMYQMHPDSGKSEGYHFPVRVDDVTPGDGYCLILSGDTVYRFVPEK